MPFPTPNSGESRSDFIGRCVRDENIQAESDNNDQAVAICSTIWEEKTMEPNEILLKSIQDRNRKETEFNYGILTADRYVRNILDCCGHEACNRYATTKTTSFDDVIKKAANTLVYSNPDMIVEEQFAANTRRAEALLKEVETEETGELVLPKNTLMVFKHVLTTPRKDRDGDILRTDGAEIDPKLPLLWQHVHTLPIGKMIAIAEHNANRLSLVSAIVDINEVAHDAAVMVDNDMGRFSHGFRAMLFDDLKEEEGDTTSPAGFDIKRFEIMEESIVSVPSNVDAEVEDVIVELVEGRRLTSGLMKEHANSIRSRRPVTVPVNVEISVNGEVIKSGNDKCKCGKTGSHRATDGCRPSKETEATVATKEEGRQTEVANTKVVGGPLDGSWEWIEMELRRAAKEFLQNNAVGVSERDWVYLVATFSDHAVVCVEKPEGGVPDEFRYFKVDWALEDKTPMFKGTPVQVEIVTTTELIERFPNLISRKILNEQKASYRERLGDYEIEIEGTSKEVIDQILEAKRMNRREVNALVEIKDDLEELKGSDGMTRGGNAICERCIAKLTRMIESHTPDDETSAEQTIDTKGAMNFFLTNANETECRSMFELLKVIVRRADDREKANKIRASLGS